MIGEARAKKILNCIKTTNIQARLLAEIPSITKKTALKILEKFTITELYKKRKDKYFKKKLSSIKKTEKTKLGKAATEKLLKYISL